MRSVLVLSLPLVLVSAFQVMGDYPQATGPYMFTVIAGTPSPPDDVCEGANVIPPCSQGHYSGDLASYHNDYDSPT